MELKIIGISKDKQKLEYHHYNDLDEAIEYLIWVNEDNGDKGEYNPNKMALFIRKGGKAYVCDNKDKKIYLVPRDSEENRQFVKLSISTQDRISTTLFNFFK